MMDASVIKSLLEANRTGPHGESLESQIIKTVSWQIEVLGQKYLTFLKEQGLLNGLIQKLWQANNDNQKVEVIPLNWMEAKIQKIRKLAVESTKQLGLESWDTTVYLIDKKELIFKRIHPQNKNVIRFNAPL